MKFPQHKIITGKIIMLISIATAVIILLIHIAVVNEKAKENKNSEEQEIILQIPTDIIENLNSNGGLLIDSEEQNFIYKSHGNGTCSLIDMTNKEAVEVQIPTQAPNGEIITKISSTAFKSCKKLTSVTIPSSIKEIDNRAFIDCTNLVVIMTSSSNTSFCSVGGVLFSKDKTELVCYPQNKVGSVYLLNSNTKKIRAYAFYNINNLQKILYEDSVKRFSLIEIEPGNQNFQKLPIVCNYVAEK